MIPIIDYCLGSGKCGIPVGVIRERVSWFGVVLARESGELLLARREPGEQQSTGDMYVSEGLTAEVPDLPTKNSNLESAKNRLNQFARLSNLDIEPPGPGVAYAQRPSFRDLMAFVFQPQHLIANPFTVFYKADTTEHREKLKNLFPFVLGAVDNDHLAKMHQLADLERLLEIRRRELSAIREAARVWEADLKAYYAEAVEVGLLAGIAEGIDHWQAPERVKLLSRVNVDASDPLELKLGGDNTTRAAAELASLRGEERQAAGSLETLRRHLAQVRDVASVTSAYQEALVSQQDRLEVVEWLVAQIGASPGVCPICGARGETAKKEAHALLESLQTLKRRQDGVSSVPEILDRERLDVERAIRMEEEHLNTVRRQLHLRESHSLEAQRVRQTAAQINHFKGRLAEALRNYEASKDSGDLAEKVQDLESQVQTLKADIEPERTLQRRLAAEAKANGFMQGYLRDLGVERPDDPVRLDIDNLTLRILSATGRSDYLWELGSGSNWLGYHLACLLGLHEFFAKQPFSPVPSFIVLDQPSQVYFPVLRAGAASSADMEVRKLPMRDLEELRRVFATLRAAIGRTAGSLQVVVVEQAESDVWNNDEAHLVARWRNGDKLIPAEWCS